MPNTNVPSFPNAVPTDAVLTVASNNAQTTLSGNINDSVTSIAVTSAAAFAVPCLIVVDSEIILAGDKSGNTFTECVRGFNGTTPDAHTDTTAVYGYILAHHHNQLAAEVTSIGNHIFNFEMGGFKRNENLLTYSELFSDAYWTKSSNASVTVDVAALPNGSLGYSFLEGDSLGKNKIAALPGGLVVGDTYTFSVFAKYDSIQWLAIGQNLDHVSEERWAFFDVQNGVIGTVGADADASIVAIGDGWYRCVVVVQCTNDATKTFELCLATSDGTFEYLGTATDSTLIAAAQVRAGGLDGPITYIKTNGTAFSLVGSGDLVLDQGSLAAGIPLQERRGTTVEHSSFTGKIGEITVDTTKKTVVVHDGSTAGGVPLAKEVHTHSAATTSVDGFMSAADKTKLDSIAGGTINYQTVQANGTPVTQRAALNLSSAFTLTDDGAGNRTSVDLADSGVGAGTYTKVTVSAKGRVTAATLLAAGDIPNLTAAKITDFDTQVRTSRLDQMTIPTADLNVNSNKVINVATPTDPTDAANKQYVDATATGLSFKEACIAASTGSNVNLAAPGTSIDAVTLTNGDRVLIKDQSTASENGIYIFNGASTPMTRALDANETAEVKPGMFVLVTEGNNNANVGYVLSTAAPITVGVTDLDFVAFSSAGTVVAGDGIDVTGTTVSVVSVSSARIAVGVSGIDLATIGGLTPGTYSRVTVDAYGRVTGTAADTYQPLAANLTGVAALASNGFTARTGAGTFASRTLQPGTGIGITNQDGVSGNPSISVTDDTTIQKVRVSKGGTLQASRREINFIEGSGITITTADNSGSNRMDVTFDVVGGGGGAPTTSQYVTLATDGTLTNERVLVVGAGLLMVDGGAGNNLTLSFQTDLGTVP